MQMIFNFIKGIFIGLGAILPGISSGVICIIVGLYEPLLNSVLNFFKDIKGNIKFLFPIITGAIAGIVLFSKILLYCFNIIPCQIKSLFIGLLLGSIYVLAQTNIYDSVNKKENKYTVFFICFLIGLGLINLENIISNNSEHMVHEFSYLYLVLSGFFMSIGIIVPRC